MFCRYFTRGTTARPNGGRLELQRDMSLIGVKDASSAVVIDAGSLPDSSFKLFSRASRRSKIREQSGLAGQEFDRMATIVGKPNSASGIETDLTDTGPKDTVIRVAQVVRAAAVADLTLEISAQQWLGAL